MVESFATSNYDSAEAWCKKVVQTADALLFHVDVFDNEINEAAINLRFPVESLSSFLRNIHLKHVKKNAHILRNNINSLLKDYIDGISILDLSKLINYPPSMVARAVVEHVAFCDSSNNRKLVTEAMRDPIGKLGSMNAIAGPYQKLEKHVEGSLVRMDQFSGRPIPSLAQVVTRLALEVLEAVDADPLYGPRYDKERNIVGLEHEILLEQALISMKIPFETEGQLRKRGTARTPDILFSCPVAIRIPKRESKSHAISTAISEFDTMQLQENCKEYVWKMVCWIDSKALFGDIHTHQTSVLPQAEMYVHRFGPGLILYWFGHAPLERLGDGHGDVLITGWNIPELFLLPTGDLGALGKFQHTA